MIIGFDFDGVIAKKIFVPRWLPNILILFILVFAPEIKNLKVVRSLGRRHRIIIVTSRQEECRFITWLWLRLHRVPFIALYCVGNESDKTSALKKEEVEVFFDDKPRYVDAASQHGITAYLFQDWKETKKIISAIQDERIKKG